MYLFFFATEQYSIVPFIQVYLYSLITFYYYVNFSLIIKLYLNERITEVRISKPSPKTGKYLSG